MAVRIGASPRSVPALATRANNTKACEGGESSLALFLFADDAQLGEIAQLGVVGSSLSLSLGLARKYVVCVPAANLFASFSISTSPQNIMGK